MLVKDKKKDRDWTELDLFLCKSKYVTDFCWVSVQEREKNSSFLVVYTLDLQQTIFSPLVSVFIVQWEQYQLSTILLKEFRYITCFLLCTFLITSIRLSPHQKDKENFAFACYIFPNMCIYTFLHSQFVLKLSSFYFLHLELVS